MQDIKVSCWYGHFKGAIEVELYGFYDASVSGYSCCIYTRYCYNDYSYTKSLVFSKSKIAPIKTQTIPRLEMQTTLSLAKSIKIFTKVWYLSFP